MDDMTNLRYGLSSLTVYRSLRGNPVIGAFETLAAEFESGPLERLLEAYADVCTLLYQSEFRGNLYDYLYDTVLYDSNTFSAEAANGRYGTLPETTRRACKHDLGVLYRLATLKSEALKQRLFLRFPEESGYILDLPDYTSENGRFQNTGNWGEQLDRIAAFHEANGVSLFAKYYAFHYSERYGLEPVEAYDPVRLSELKHYEVQRQKIIDNTMGFLKGKTFNNVLLYGDRGTGKSSTVKALLNEYREQGLRMVEIPKQELTNLDKVIRLIQDIPLKFILFIDDLSFVESDPCYGILKALLEGSLVRRPDNIAVYATTNRRHLVKETFAGREGDEVHRADTIDEALSLSDRFGLYITFMLPNKQKYLDIVRLLAEDRGLEISEETLFRGAEQFAMRKSGRSPRLAKQYIDYIQARQAMNLPLAEGGAI